MDTIRQTEPVTRVIGGAVIGVLIGGMLKKPVIGALIGAISGYIAPGVGK